MFCKQYRYIMCVLFIICSAFPGIAISITADDFADKYQSAKKKIRDVSLEYEYRTIPAWTFSELKEKGENTDGLILWKDGVKKCKLSFAGFIDANDPTGRLRWRYVYEESFVAVMENGKSWDSITIQSFDGRVYKKFTTGEKSFLSGIISADNLDDRVLLDTPLGFSIFRLDDETKTKDITLSSILHQHKDMIQVTSLISRVNDFNTTRIDLLQRKFKLPYTRIYLSVDHDYAPVKYEHLKDIKTGEVAITVEAHSFEQIADSLWFPTSGLIRMGNEDRVNTFQVKGKILVNQGLSDKDFDVKFPIGTKVSDQITRRKYTVGAENK